MVVIIAAGAIIYTAKKYVSLGESYKEKARELEQKKKDIETLNKQIEEKNNEIKDLEAEKKASDNSGAASLLLRQKEQEITSLKKKVTDLESLKEYSRCDTLVEEYKNEYNNVVDMLFTTTKSVCAKLYFGSTPFNDKSDLKDAIDAEVDVEQFKAGYLNLTNSTNSTR